MIAMQNRAKVDPPHKRRIDYVFDNISLVNEWVGKCLRFVLLALTAVVVLGVGARYLFNNPLNWNLDVSIFLYAGLIILSGGYVLKRDAHVRVDIFERRLSESKGAILRLAVAPLFFLFVGVFMWQTSIYAYTSVMIRERISDLWAPYVYPIKLLMPVGCLLLFLQGLCSFSRDLRVVLQGRKARGKSR